MFRDTDVVHFDTGDIVRFDLMAEFRFVHRTEKERRLRGEQACLSKSGSAGLRHQFDQQNSGNDRISLEMASEIVFIKAEAMNTDSSSCIGMFQFIDKEKWFAVRKNFFNAHCQIPLKRADRGAHTVVASQTFVVEPSGSVRWILWCRTGRSFSISRESVAPV